MMLIFVAKLQLIMTTSFGTRGSDISTLKASSSLHKNRVTSLPIIKAPYQLCESCVVGKKLQGPFCKGRACRASKPLELVYSDLCYVEVPSNGGNKYFIIDDFTRKT